MAITFETYARNNLCYKAARKMPQGSPAGIIVHSTGANNPNLRRYVNAPDICGENPYKNYYDSADIQLCPHAVIGLDKNGKIRAAKLLPWNICCWGCGNGSKGSYNYSPAYIQIEICEDGLTDKQYFEQAFGLAVQLCQRLMKNYPTIKPENIISHHEAHLRGYASNHADCDHWLKKFGKNMDWFRGVVSGEKQVIISAVATLPESCSEELQRKLSALGMTVTAEYI
ncbi:MAG: peptidoglycan recognition protein family protein [Oscillospiraceae bacterium]|nr:peptidoglycan recognition protein family protein [Oscillospiraceae bacterium]